MSFCMFCGNELKEGATFCGHCGSPVNARTNQASVYNNVNQPVEADSNIMAERAKALDIVDRAIKHFAPYQGAFKEYYLYLSTTWVKVARHSLAIIIPACIATIPAVIMTVLMIAGKVADILGIINLFIAVALWAAEIFRHMRKSARKKQIKNHIIAMDRTLMNVYEKCPVKEHFSPEYSLPQLMEQVGTMINSGRANSFDEALLVVKSNLEDISRTTIDSALKQALKARRYKGYADMIKDENGNSSIHFLMD